MERDSVSSPEEGIHKKGSNTSEIAEFFNGKSIFITGGAGFVGSVLLESLLSCCPGIQKIYLLIREKKGASADSRKATIFQKRIFQPLKKKQPDVFAKVRAIQGDVTYLDLGISSSALEELKEHVSVVFHCAAVISFMKPLRYMIQQNVLGTENVVNLCRQLPKLLAFVYTSTAYSNCNRMENIKEEIYKLTVPAEQFICAVRSNCEDEILSEMQLQCVPAWPNTYTFSKAMTEELLNNVAEDFPVAIIRPSIILSSYKGPMPGYVEEGSGIIDVSLGIGKGFIRVLYCDEDKHVDLVPVDGVANALIIAAWSVATKKMSSPLVINCVSGEMNPCIWGYFVNTLYQMTLKNPVPKMYQKPSLVLRKFKVSYWASAIMNHYVPALCLDLLLRISGKKPKLTKMYRVYDTALSCLSYFLVNEWRFDCKNFKHLAEMQSAADEELFPVDTRGYNADCIANSIKENAPFYQWEIDNRLRKDRLPLANRRYMITTFIKWTVIIWLLVLAAFIVTRAFSKTSYPTPEYCSIERIGELSINRCAITNL